MPAKLDNSLKANEIIIGKKDIAVYVFSCVLQFKANREIKLKAMGRNIGTLDRIVSLMANLGVAETNRTSKPHPEEKSLEIITSSLKRRA